MPRSPTHRRALARSTIIPSGKSSSFSESVFKSGGVIIDQVGLAVSPPHVRRGPRFVSPSDLPRRGAARLCAARLNALKCDRKP